MKITNKLTGRVFVMPKIEQKYINRAKKSELKVLYSIFMHGGEIDIKGICAEIEEGEDAVNAALAFWRGAGVIEDSGDDAGEPEKTIPEDMADAKKVKPKSAGSSYSLHEITSMSQNNKVFASLVSYFEKITGHLYNASEQSLILYLYDTLGIDCEVIMGVAQHCVSIGKNSVRYIQQVCINIHESGVRTYAELENYFASNKKKDDFQSMVKAVIGADDRAFSAAELKHINKWLNEFGCSEELVSFAYEKTIAKINRPQISYMSKILESWYQNGLKTPEQVEEFFKKGEKKSTGNKSGRLEFNLDDIFEKPDIPPKP